jgi:large subunit ribosomal protein L3
MEKFILGTKQEMTQVFDEDGNVIPSTLIEAGPVVVTQLKSEEPRTTADGEVQGKKDGYNAVQVGFGRKSLKRINKPQKKDKAYRWIREFRISKDNSFEVGQKIDVSIFNKGDVVKISGLSKGKGFQGVVKRWGFHGGPRTHGQKHSEREPGSIGATGPQRVFKGKKMPGRMGGKRVSVQNLKVVDVIPERNILVVSGAVPGHRGTLLEIRG